MYWLGLCNNLHGKFDLVETRYFPTDHDNPRRLGAKIVAFEGNQEFLDSLHKFPKDFPFNIRFGGNLYIRGGERYTKFPKTYHIKPYKKVTYLTYNYTYLLYNIKYSPVPIYLPYTKTQKPYPTLSDM